LEEVSVLVEYLRGLSSRESISFELELDGDCVGSIRKGEMDRSLSLGLLGEWRRHLGAF